MTSESLIHKALWFVWMGCFLAITVTALIIAGFVFKEVGWDAPYRWLCITGMISYIIEQWILP